VSSPSFSPDWTAIARTPRFRALVQRRRRFVVAGTLFYTGYFIVYLALLGYAHDFMSKEVLGSFSLALLGGFSLCVLAPIMAWLYARRAGEWEREAEAAVQEAQR
jgi:uncharacterized membrane protein (DUF485 family)